MNAVSPAQPLSVPANASAPRLSRWDIIGGIVLPIVAIAGQVLDDTVGPWLTFGYAPLGILALLVSTKTLVTPLQRALICGANFDCAAGSLVNALDHFLYSYFFIWPATLVLVMLPAAAAAQVNTRRALRLFCQGIGFRG